MILLLLRVSDAISENGGEPSWGGAWETDKKEEVWPTSHSLDLLDCQLEGVRGFAVGTTEVTIIVVSNLSKRDTSRACNSSEEVHVEENKLEGHIGSLETLIESVLLYSWLGNNAIVVIGVGLADVGQSCQGRVFLADPDDISIEDLSHNILGNMCPGVLVAHRDEREPVANGRNGTLGPILLILEERGDTVVDLNHELRVHLDEGQQEPVEGKVAMESFYRGRKATIHHQHDHSVHEFRDGTEDHVGMETSRTELGAESNQQFLLKGLALYQENGRSKN